jgi:nicotinate-nucleotide adenylyltransferase
MSEIGFFGGSFDPIHFGHINLALEIKEKLNLEKILFCPTFISPFKENAPIFAKPEDRLEMLKLAIKDIKGFEIIDFEIKNKKISYTVDTLYFLKKSYNNLRLIITDDALQNFHLWKDYKEILKIAPLIIGTRSKVINDFKSLNLNLKPSSFVKTSIFEISSTVIRDRLKKRLYIGHLTAKEVLDYICNRGLYL